MNTHMPVLINMIMAAISTSPSLQELQDGIYPAWLYNFMVSNQAALDLHQFLEVILSETRSAYFNTNYSTDQKRTSGIIL